MKRRRRLVLRRNILSFKPPPRLTVFRQIRFAYDSSDEDLSNQDAGNTQTVHCSDEQKSLQKTSRKRVRNEAAWKRNVIKKARESGSAYVNYRKVQVPAKQPCSEEILCHSKCRFHCSDKLTEENRKAIFTAYYSMSRESQNMYLFVCITTLQPKWCLNDASRHREVSAAYSVRVNGKKVRVCKKAFERLHAILQAKVNHIIDQCKSGLTVPRPSACGKHNSRPNRKSEEQRNMVRTHISSFPAEKSHHSRARNNSRMYLSPTLSIASMHTDYKRECAESNKKPVSDSMHRNIFCSEFNLGFGSPQSDTCMKCDAKDVEGLIDIKQHKRNAETAFKQQRADREAAKAGLCTYITFDMEKTLPLPKLSAGVVFYLRLYNAGVHLITKNAEARFLQIWTENEGQRNE